MMTQPDLPFLQSDRIILKLYACEEHLKNIKDTKLQYGDLIEKCTNKSLLNGSDYWVAIPSCSGILCPSQLDLDS